MNEKLTINKGGWHEFADVVFCKDYLLFMNVSPINHVLILMCKH